MNTIDIDMFIYENTNDACVTHLYIRDRFYETTCSATLGKSADTSRAIFKMFNIENLRDR